MRVFRIKSDFAFQSFFPYDPEDLRAPEIVKAEILAGRTLPRLTTWIPVALRPSEPDKTLGDFGRLWGFGGYAISERGRELLFSTLSDCCEFLPFLPFEGHHYYRLNTIERIDCLDKETTRFAINKVTGKETTEIVEYHFDSKRLRRTSLFMLRNGSMLFTVEGLSDCELEFKSIIERENLTGLKFEELWSEEGPPIRLNTFAEKHFRGLKKP